MNWWLTLVVGLGEVAAASYEIGVRGVLGEVTQQLEGGVDFALAYEVLASSKRLARAFSIWASSSRPFSGQRELDLPAAVGDWTAFDEACVHQAID